MIKRVIRTHSDRQWARYEISLAPLGHEVTIKEPTRSDAQNNKMWAMLEAFARSKPYGRAYPKESWKCVLMSAFGIEVDYVQGLNNEPVHVGFRASKMNTAQMADFITFIQATGDELGGEWSDE